MTFNTPTCEHGIVWNICFDCRPGLKEKLSAGFTPKSPWSPCIGPDCTHPQHKKQNKNEK